MKGSQPCMLSGYYCSLISVILPRKGCSCNILFVAKEKQYENVLVLLNYSAFTPFLTTETFPSLVQSGECEITTVWVFTHRETPVSRMQDGYVLSTLHLMHHINNSGAAMMLQIPGHDVSHTLGP